MHLDAIFLDEIAKYILLLGHNKNQNGKAGAA